MFKQLRILLPIILLSFQVQAQDAGVIRFTSPTLPITPGFSPIEIISYNFDSISLTNVIVEWTFDSAPQASTPYTGAPISPLDSVNVILGNLNIPPGCHIIKAWTNLPNNTSDIIPSNDTFLLNTCFTGIAPSLNEISNKILEADIYPNPSIEDFILHLKIRTPSDIKVEIVDLKGKSVFHKDYGLLTGEFKAEINLKHLPKGMYFLHLWTREGFLNKKLIIGS
jgi:hypothetical protein